MARAVDPGVAYADAGRTALRALAEAVGPTTPRQPLGLRLRDDPDGVRDALCLLVARAAFVRAVTARGFVLGSPEEAFQRWFSHRHDPSLSPELAACALSALEAQEDIDFARLTPEALGRIYEGTLGTALELAVEPSVVVSQRKRAGAAPTEVVVALRELLRLAGSARVEKLVALGVSLEARARREVSGASDHEALCRALVSSRVARGRFVPAGRVALRLTAGRQQSGSHYTSEALAERVVERALAPLFTDGASLAGGASSERWLALRICDPAMGTGAFLVAACRLLAARVTDSTPSRNAQAKDVVKARRAVALSCLFGVDRDPAAVEVARLAVWLGVGDPELPLDFADGHLRVGEALLGPPNAPAARASAEAFDWLATFSSVCVDRGGFDAFVGNPPWVSYVGRAAQPLAPELRAAYRAYESFAGYKNLQGLFVERSARLLRAGGRLGLLLPSSMSELSGYSPTRRAHDRLCEPDTALTDLGDADFDGVFQPCMVLSSTRREQPLESAAERPWPMERPDLDELARGIIEKMDRRALPAELFGERGLQSMGEDTRHFADALDDRHSVPLRTGSDIRPFRLGAPSLFADPGWFGTRLRSAADWARVRFVVRQTARAPLAALSDGVAFRNSLLAGFADEEYPAEFLVAYLNSSPIRWLHYVRHRDARQGLPQLKVMHLRRTPAPPRRELVRELSRLGADLSTRAGTIDAGAQEALDRSVADAFRLSERERERIASARSLFFA